MSRVSIPENLRELVLSLGRILVPATPDMPGFHLDSLQRFEIQLGRLGESAGKQFLSLLRILGWRAGIFGGKVSQRQEKRLARAVQRLYEGSTPERQLFKTIGVMMKLSHYDAKEVYGHVGIAYNRTRPAKEKETYGGLLSLQDLKELGEMEIDAVVVGTGAGGAVMAYELARAGFITLMVEEGLFHKRPTFNRSSAEATEKLYRNKGMTFTVGNPPIFLPTGVSVGGTTTINSGTCYRPPERVLQKWQGLGVDGWDMDTLHPHFQQVEQHLGVARAKAPYLGGCADVIAKGCEILGYDHKPLQRNAQGCDGQGVCALGCPTDAKRSTNVSYVPMALKAGAYLTAGTRLEDLNHEGDRVKSVSLKHLESGVEIDIPCKLLVLSMGSLNTPLFLQKVGLKHAQLCKNLSIHPAASVVAEFDHEIRGDLAIPQGYAIESFHDQGILFEGGFVPMEVLASSTYLYGKPLQELMHNYKNVANFGFMVEDLGKGRILKNIGDFPLVYYQIDKEDTRRLQKGLEILSGVFLAAGAKRVRPQLQKDVVIENWEDLRAFSATRIKPSFLELSAYHPLGTARMAKDPTWGVVNCEGRVHGWKNLFVADGSILPSSPAVNPQITIMGASSLIASKIQDQHQRFGIQLS